MPAKGDRVAVGMSKLAKKIQTTLDSRSVYQAASEWGIPHWIIRDTLSGKIDCPSPKYLKQVAHGLGWSIDDVIDAAYTEEEAASA